MEQNYNNDNLENFFRDHLKGLEEQPDASNWDAIKGQIPPPPKMPFGLALWASKIPLWIGLLILGLAIGYSVYLYQQMEGLKATNAQQALIIEQLDGDVSALKKEHNALRQSELDENDMISSSADARNSADQYAVLNNTTPSRASTLASFNTESGIEEVVGNIETSTTSSQNNTQVRKGHALVGIGETASDYSLKSFDVQPIPTLRPQLLIHIEDRASFSSQKDKNGNWYVGVMAKYFTPDANRRYSGINVVEGGAGAGMSFKQNRGLDLIVGHQLNDRWSVEGGLGILVSDASYYNSSIFTYDESGGTVLGDNTTIGNYCDCDSLTVAPSFSYRVVNQKFNDGDDINNGDYFEANARYNYTRTYVHVPLWIKYTFNNRKQLNPYFKAGMSANFLKKKVYDLNESSVSFSRLNIANIVVNEKVTRQTFMGLSLAAGMQVNFNSNLSVSVEAAMYDAVDLSSLRSVTDIAPIGMGLSTGVSYKF